MLTPEQIAVGWVRYDGKEQHSFYPSLAIPGITKMITNVLVEVLHQDYYYPITKIVAYRAQEYYND